MAPSVRGSTSTSASTNAQGTARKLLTMGESVGVVVANRLGSSCLHFHPSDVVVYQLWFPVCLLGSVKIIACLVTSLFVSPAHR